jgi:hypothetical protein
VDAPDTPYPDELEIMLVGRPDRYTVVMEARGKGQRFGEFDAPLSGTELESFRSALDPPTQARHLDPARVLEQARNLGERLLTALTADRDLMSNFTSARAAATDGGRELRVKIQTQGAPDLTAVPWELLYERPRFLAQTPRLSVVRYANLGDQLPLTPPVIEGRVRILGRTR